MILVISVLFSVLFNILQWRDNREKIHNLIGDYMTITFIHNVLPIISIQMPQKLQTYLTNKVSVFGCVIFTKNMEHLYCDDYFVAKVKVCQNYRTLFMRPLLFRFSDKFRLKCAIEAYSEYIMLYPSRKQYNVAISLTPKIMKKFDLSPNFMVEYVEEKLLSSLGIPYINHRTGNF